MEAAAAFRETSPDIREVKGQWSRCLTLWMQIQLPHSQFLVHTYRFRLLQIICKCKKKLQLWPLWKETAGWTGCWFFLQDKRCVFVFSGLRKKNSDYRSQNPKSASQPDESHRNQMMFHLPTLTDGRKQTSANNGLLNMIQLRLMRYFWDKTTNFWFHSDRISVCRWFKKTPAAQWF